MRLEKLVRLLKISRRFELGTVKWIAKTLNFTQEFYFLRPQVFFFCILLPGAPPGPPGPPGGGRRGKKKKIKVSRALDTKGA